MPSLLEAQDDGVRVAITMGELVGGHKVIRVGPDGLGYRATALDRDSARTVIGLTDEALPVGFATRLVSAGPLRGFGGSIVRGVHYYLGDLGALTTDPAAYPIYLPLGVGF